jgi:methyl-accepting chemotaxis protein
MEELARTSASIADNVDAVAQQAAETRDALVEAQEDIRASSERTVALAHQVEEIDAILTLINEIADKTSLLALNAAIEAERAGESGRGFTVVAEEVRRLADRSKDSASRIAGIVAGTKAETNATVMAMETGSKQMRRGLDLMEAVTVATSQVQLTTEQQRAATQQVVEVMEQIASAVRATSATAVQVAEASSDLVSLAVGLDDVAGQRGEQHDADAAGAAA